MGRFGFGIWSPSITPTPSRLWIGIMPKNILKSSPTLLFPRVPHRTHWLDGVTQALWEGQVEDVIAACEARLPLASSPAKPPTISISMPSGCAMPRFRAAGYMIGSGTVESGCKQIVTQRLKLPGARSGRFLGLSKRRKLGLLG